MRKVIEVSESVSALDRNKNSMMKVLKKVSDSLLKNGHATLGDVQLVQYISDLCYNMNIHWNIEVYAKDSAYLHKVDVGDDILYGYNASDFGLIIPEEDTLRYFVKGYVEGKCNPSKVSISTVCDRARMKLQREKNISADVAYSEMVNLLKTDYKKYIDTYTPGIDKGVDAFIKNVKSTKLSLQIRGKGGLVIPEDFYPVLRYNKAQETLVTLRVDGYGSSYEAFQSVKKAKKLQGIIADLCRGMWVEAGSLQGVQALAFQYDPESIYLDLRKCIKV